ncbi:MAG: GNAT family N-acetyltransferase [Anaerolineae bacterium]|jgi:GNAT superfamily N-acetyltransferase
MSTDNHLTVEEHPAHHDIAFLEQRIIDYNYGRTGASDGRGLACFVRDDAGQIVAGISGYTWAGMAEIEFLWVDDSLRGQGVGSRLLAAVEAEARQRGCKLIVTSTYSFQAPDFYPRYGYEVVGSIENCPPGHENHWLKKDLLFDDDLNR